MSKSRRVGSRGVLNDAIGSLLLLLVWGSLNGLVVDELDSREESQWLLTRSKHHLKCFVCYINQ